MRLAFEKGYGKKKIMLCEIEIKGKNVENGPGK